MAQIYEMTANSFGSWQMGAVKGAPCAIRMIGGNAGKQDDRVFAAPHDRLFYVLEGTATVLLGADEISVSQDQLVRVPPDVPFRCRAAKDALLLEVAAPGGPALDQDLHACEPRKVADAGQYVISLDPSKFTKRAFSNQSLLGRGEGFDKLRLSVFHVQPGAGSPDFHIHAFDQYFVILDGAMTLDVGRNRYTAQKHNLVILPAGVVHRNFNAGSVMERHINILVPEPMPGQIFDYAVDIHDREAQHLKGIPEKLS